LGKKVFKFHVSGDDWSLWLRPEKGIAIDFLQIVLIHVLSLALFGNNKRYAVAVSIGKRVESSLEL